MDVKLYYNGRVLKGWKTGGAVALPVLLTSAICRRLGEVNMNR